MNDGTLTTRLSAPYQDDPCLSGLVHRHDGLDYLRDLESRPMSVFESAMLLARLLAPDAEEAPLRRPPATSIQPLDLLNATAS